MSLDASGQNARGPSVKLDASQAQWLSTLGAPSAPLSSTADGAPSVFPTLGAGASPLHGGAPPSLTAMFDQLQQLESIKNAYASLLANASKAAATQKQEPPTLYTEDDVPKIIDNLSSEENGVFDKATQALLSIRRHQPDLLHSAVLPLLPSIFSLILTATNEASQSILVDVVSNIAAASREASAALRKHADVEQLVKALKKCRSGGTLIRRSFIRLLESMLRSSCGCGGDGGDLEARLLEVLHTQFYTLENRDEGASEAKGKGKAKAKAPDATNWDIDDGLSVIKTFELLLLQAQMGSLLFVSLKAGALDFIILVATTPSAHSSLPPSAVACNSTPPASTHTDLRIAAVRSLANLYRGILYGSILASDFPRLHSSSDARFELQGQILMPLLDIMNDPDVAVSDEVIDFLYSHRGDPDMSVMIFLCTHEGSLARLVHKLALASGRTRTGGQSRSEAWALMKMMGIGLDRFGFGVGNGGNDKKVESESEGKGKEKETKEDSQKQDESTAHGTQDHMDVDGEQTLLSMLDMADSRPPAEWLLSWVAEQDPDGVSDAFGAFWERADVEEGARRVLLKVLSGAVLPVREAAVRAGVPVPNEGVRGGNAVEMEGVLVSGGDTGGNSAVVV